MGLTQLYALLYETYGPQGWWPGDSPFEIAVGAILTQATAWRNVEKAIQNLKDADALRVGALFEAPPPVLERWLRPCGYYRVKARRLRAFLCHLRNHHHDSLDHLLRQPLEVARKELLTIWGIGPETADSILLYAGGHPSFVVDRYTYRLLSRLGWWSGPYAYESIRGLFMQRLPQDVSLFNEYHALIVRHGVAHCAKVPRCAGCALKATCPTGNGTGSSSLPP